MEVVNLEDLARVFGGAPTSEAIGEIIKLRLAQIDALKAWQQDPTNKDLAAQENKANGAAANAFKAMMGAPAASASSASAPEIETSGGSSISSFLSTFWD